VCSYSPESLGLSGLSVDNQWAMLTIHYLNANGTAPEWLTMGYLWYNVVGCGLVVGFGVVLEMGMRKRKV
jgi:hypothetical protein